MNIARLTVATSAFQTWRQNWFELKVDLIVTRSTPAVLAVKAATSTIPVIMAATANPVGDGVVMDIARPGGNITGLSSFHTELSPKRVELLERTGPRNCKNRNNY